MEGGGLKYEYLVDNPYSWLSGKRFSDYDAVIPKLLDWLPLTNRNLTLAVSPG